MAIAGNVLALKTFSFGTDKTWDAASAAHAAEQTVNAPGVRKGDMVLVQKPTYQTDLAYSPLARVDADDVLTIQFINQKAAGDITPTALEAWTGAVIRFEKPLYPNAYC